MPLLENVMFLLILSISLPHKNALPMDEQKCKARLCRCERVGVEIDGGGMVEATEAGHGGLLLVMT